MQREIFQQPKVKMLFAATLSGGATSDDFEPAPEGFFAVEFPRMPDDAQQGFLQCFPGFVLLPARDPEQKLIEPMEVKPVEFPKGIFVAGPDAGREGGDVRGGA